MPPAYGFRAYSAFPLKLCEVGQGLSFSGLSVDVGLQDTHRLSQSHSQIVLDVFSLSF